MRDIDWKAKLTSRKFWVAVVGFLTALLTAFNVDGNVIVQVTAVIMAFGSLIAYIVGEGLVDAAAVQLAAVQKNKTADTAEPGAGEDTRA